MAGQFKLYDMYDTNHRASPERDFVLLKLICIDHYILYLSHTGRRQLTGGGLM